MNTNTTTSYDYRATVTADVKRMMWEYKSEAELREAIASDNLDEFIDDLTNDLWIDDCTTGNASGSYTFNRNQALEYINGNLPLMVEAYNEFDAVDEMAINLKQEDYEVIDVAIRCYLLPGIVSDVVNAWVSAN